MRRENETWKNVKFSFLNTKMKKKNRGDIRDRGIFRFLQQNRKIEIDYCSSAIVSSPPPHLVQSEVEPKIFTTTNVFLHCLQCNIHKFTRHTHRRWLFISIYKINRKNIYSVAQFMNIVEWTITIDIIERLYVHMNSH